MSRIHPAFVLIASLLVALSGWGISFESWAETTRVSNVFALFGIVGGVLLAWLGTSPLKPNGLPKGIIKLGLLLIVGLLLLSLPAMAQEPYKDVVAAGVSWNQQATPQINGTLVYGALIGTGLYSFNLVDVTPQTYKPFVITTNITFGLAQHMRDIGIVKVYTVATAGVGAGGNNVGFAWTAGGAAFIPLGKKGLFLLPNVRVLKNTLSEFQGIYGIAIGWGK
jgi:hypothetical protein